MKAIIACDPNGGIGYKGKLPWDKIEGDLPRFKALTLGQKIIMGRNTWDSLPVKPLPNRTSIVLSSRKITVPQGVQVVSLLTSKDTNSWIIGGAAVINSHWNIIDEIHLSRVFKEYECDTYIDLRRLEDQFSCTWKETLSDHNYEIWRRN